MAVTTGPATELEPTGAGNTPRPTAGAHPGRSAPSPLEAIERLVQDSAKRLRLDPEQPASRLRLRQLIENEVAQWTIDARQGLRPFELADPEALTERIWNNIVEYGPLTRLLDDPDVWEIEINGPGEIFVKRHGRPSGYHDEVFSDDEQVVRVLTRMCERSSGSHRKLDPNEGLQDAQLDNGARLHIVHADLARGGHLLVNIRRFTGVGFTELRELVANGTLSEAAARFLSAAVRSRLSIVFAGAPGSGKTTLLSCCAAQLDPSLRVVTAEEVFEVDIPLPNVAAMQTRPARPDRPAVDLRRLVAGFLRMAPDVAVVGEVRDREALPLLLTLSSGVTGYTTIHAGSARQALTRLRFICQLADTGANLPLSALNTLVSESVDVVVHSERTDRGPRVTEILAVEDLAGGPDAAQFTTTPLFVRSADGVLAWSGHLPARASEAMERHGYEIRELLDRPVGVHP